MNNLDAISKDKPIASDDLFFKAEEEETIVFLLRSISNNPSAVRVDRITIVYGQSVTQMEEKLAAEKSTYHGFSDLAIHTSELHLDIKNDQLRSTSAEHTNPLLDCIKEGGFPTFEENKEAA